MSSTKEEFKHCEHLEEVSSYCHECKIFCCEDCSLSHLEHLENLDAWDSLIKEYLIGCKNSHSRLKIILKMLGAGGTSRGEILTKIDACFKDLHRRIDEHKVQVKKDIFAKLPKEFMEDSRGNLDQSKFNPSEIKRMIQDLDVLMKEMDFYNERNQKKEMIDLLKKDILKEVEESFKFDMDLKTLGSAKPIQFPFWIRHMLDDYEKFLPNIESCPDIQRGKKSLSKDVTEDYFWFENKERKQRIWQKAVAQSGKSYSYCSPTLLPKEFKLTLKVNNFIQSPFGVFGVSKVNFGLTRGWLPWTDDQYTFCTEGHGHGYPSKRGGELKGNVCELIGDTHICSVMNGIQTGDIFILTLKNHILSMMHNAKQLLQVFHHVHPPLYFCASLYFDNSQIEILQVLDISLL